MILDSKHIAIDEEGLPLIGEAPLKDPKKSAEILKNIYLAENGSFATSLDGEIYLIEAFDAPWVAQSVQLDGETLHVLLPFDVKVSLSAKSLSLDEWDRFHATHESGVTCVFSDKAQGELFDLADSYTDESISLNGKNYELKAWLQGTIPKNADQFWTERYQQEDTGWELNQAAPALVDMLPRLKLPRSRVLVLGCGSGNDAAYFAQQGHIVTAVDISAEALNRAKSKYSGLSIQWVQADIFKLPPQFKESFDLIFEHTCFCAINPEDRSKLVQIWTQLLAPNGLLMGVFYVMDKAGGPPFGGSEWEVRKRLQKSFHFLFWGRWKGSVEGRSGKELFVYAKKRGP